MSAHIYIALNLPLALAMSLAFIARIGSVFVNYSEMRKMCVADRMNTYRVLTIA